MKNSVVSFLIVSVFSGCWLLQEEKKSTDYTYVNMLYRQSVIDGDPKNCNSIFWENRGSYLYFIKPEGAGTDFCMGVADWKANNGSGILGIDQKPLMTPIINSSIPVQCRAVGDWPVIKSRAELSWFKKSAQTSPIIRADFVFKHTASKDSSGNISLDFFANYDKGIYYCCYWDMENSRMVGECEELTYQ